MKSMNSFLMDISLSQWQSCTLIVICCCSLCCCSLCCCYFSPRSLSRILLYILSLEMKKWHLAYSSKSANWHLSPYTRSCSISLHSSYNLINYLTPMACTRNLPTHITPYPYLIFPLRLFSSPLWRGGCGNPCLISCWSASRARGRRIWCSALAF